MTEKTIDTLVNDIYDTLANPEKYDWSGVDEFGAALADMIKRRVTRKPDQPELRMSNFGQPCDRKLWYQINHPEEGEPLTPQAKFKFLYGDIIEMVVLFLAKVSGHKIEAEQEEVEINGVKGHPDAIIDGVLIDVKSANSRAFDKFKYHKLESDDPFGYLDQLSLYLEAFKDDERLKVKGEGAFLAVDKELGHIVLDKYRKKRLDYPRAIEEKQQVLNNPNPPPRAFDSVPDGASGNRKLGVACSYCAFKHNCWPGLRTFLYANGPRFLTKVERVPDVPEV